MASGWWDADGTISGCVAAYSPVGAANLAASYTNLQNPGTYDAAPGVAPTFNTATGWAFNGTTQYLDTGYTPPQVMSMVVRFSDATASGESIVIGARTGALGPWIEHWGPGNMQFRRNSSGQINILGAPATATGTAGISYTDAYINGASVGTFSTLFGISGVSLWIGAGQNSGVLYRPWPGKVQAAAIYAASLTAGEMATLHTRMLALPVASAKGLPIITHYHRQVWG